MDVSQGPGLDLSTGDNLSEGMEYVLNDFIPELDMAMDDVVKELATFGEICLVRKMMTSFDEANCFGASRTWLANQATDSFENWCTENLSFAHPKQSYERAWPNSARTMHFKERCIKHQMYV